MRESIDDPVDISVYKLFSRTEGKRVFVVTDSKIAADLRKDKESFNSYMNENINFMRQAIATYRQEIKNGNKDAEFTLNEKPTSPDYINIGQLIGMGNLPSMVASIETSCMYEEMESVERFCFDGATYIAVPRPNRYNVRAWYADDKRQDVQVEKALKQRFEVAARLQNWTPPHWMVEIDRDALIKNHEKKAPASAPKIEP